MTDDATTVMRLLEFTDSAFPVGTFSFSNGLETAAEEGLVHDAATLEQYTQDIVRQAAFTDGVAALHAFRSYNLGYSAFGADQFINMRLVPFSCSEARMSICGTKVYMSSKSMSPAVS